MHLSYLKIILALLLLTCSLSCQEGSDGVSKLLIKDVSIVDIEKGLLPNMDVLISGNRIEKIGKDMLITAHVKEMTGTGKYLMAGLWDAHVHLSFDPDIEESMLDLFMVNGITSIRDTGGQIHLVKKFKDEAELKPTHAPRVKIAGPLVDGMPRVYDGSTPQRPDISQGVNSIEEAKQAVENLVNEGVDLIKAYEMLTPELFEAVVNTADQHGLKVTGHIPLTMKVQQAAEMGLSSVEHMRNLEMSMADNADEAVVERRTLIANSQDSLGYPLRSMLHNSYRDNSILSIDPVKKKDVLTSLAKNDTWQIPTLALILSWRLAPWGDADWRKTYDYLPAAAATSWEEGCASMRELPIDPKREIFMTWASEMIDDFQEYDIPVMAGTDCPIFFLTPGFSLHRELEVLVEHAKMTPQEALKTATINPAVYFNLQDDLGTVEEGKIADLLLLDKNPLDDIKHTTSISAVIKDGYVHDSKALKDLRDKLKAKGR